MTARALREPHQPATEAELLRAMPDEMLRALSDDFIEKLPEPTRSAVRKRLGR